MGWSKARRSPAKVESALSRLLLVRENADYAQGDPQAIKTADVVAFEVEVAVQALAGKRNMPRAVRSELMARAQQHYLHDQQPSLAVVTAPILPNILAYSGVEQG